jgi:hypothetical protein
MVCSMPVQDAEWETEENAFNELLQRHDTCDAKDCLCPDGRKYVAFSLVTVYFHCHTGLWNGILTGTVFIIFGSGSSISKKLLDSHPEVQNATFSKKAL